MRILHSIKGCKNKGGRQPSAPIAFLRTHVVLCMLALGGGGTAHARAAETVGGVTFAGAAATLYAPVRAVATALGWPLHWDESDTTLYLNNQEVTGDNTLRRLPDGTVLVAVGALRHLGATVSWDSEKSAATVRTEAASVLIARGDKRVQIDRSAQRLRAWQGDLLVLEMPVSTGRSGRRTPAGTFTAGPYKSRMHYSRLYDDAPMPYSVQVSGNIFIHGFTSVPERPASHGCVRMPLDGANPARWFYEWVDHGTPIHITGRWSG